MCKGYYSPKIKEEYIPVLYYLARCLRIPMTRLVNEIVGGVLESLEDEEIVAELEAFKTEDKEFSEVSEYLGKLIQSRNRQTRQKIIKLFQEVKNEPDNNASGWRAGDARPA